MISETVGREDREVQAFTKKSKDILARLFDSKKCKLLLTDSSAVHCDGTSLI